MRTLLLAIAAALALAATPRVAPASAAPLAIALDARADALALSASGPTGPVSVALTGPDERRIELDLPSLPASLRWTALALADGAWIVEVRAAPPGALVRRAGTEAAAAATARSGASASGRVVLAGGVPITPRTEARATVASTSIPRAKDQVVADDQIVQGSVCSGFDCINNETFGDDTIRLKENNLRIAFDDTSASVGAPARDWQLTANSSSSGGQSYFAISDRNVSGFDGQNGSFRLIAGAPTDAFVVSAAGRLGLGTAAPQERVHRVASDTPGFRLEQTAVQALTPWTWDVAGNEANFFVRDITSGSLLSLRIRPGAPPSALDVAANGDVGLGTPRPTASLHQFGVAGSARARVEEVSPSTATRTLLELANNGASRLRLAQSVAASAWTASGSASFTIAPTAGAPVLTLSSGGSLSIAGTLSQGSSRTLKERIESVEPESIAERVATLPLYEWAYRADAAAHRHAGPMAEDFRAVFGTGADPASLAPSDVAAAALATLQSLARTLALRDAELAELADRLEALERRVVDGGGSRP